MAREFLIQKPWKLTAHDLHIQRGERAVLRGVCLELRPAEILSIIGPNGAGKTTLLLALLGLLKPVKGGVTLELAGATPEALSDLPDRIRGAFAAYVPQALANTPGFSVYETVATGRYPHVSAFRALGAEDDAAIRAAIDRCGLTPLTDRLLPTLSGGERQKTLLAAAIAQDAEIIFLDEPTTALDPAYQIELVQLLRNWHAAGRSLVIVSHDLNLPLRLGGRVIGLRAGAVATEGSCVEVLQPQPLKEIFGADFEQARTIAGKTVIVPAG